MNWIFLAILWVVATVGGGTAQPISCRNEHGQAVDWFIIYKKPQFTGNGQGYLYMDETTNGFVQTMYDISDRRSALAQTLKPFFDNYDNQTEDVGYILYNDHSRYSSKTISSSYGHSKGVVLMDNHTGIWLSHSTPDFPGSDIDSFWPNSGRLFGQTFICGTYNYSTFTDIAIQLQYIHVYAFNSYIPESFHTDLHLVVSKGGYPKKAPFHRQLNMTTRAGHKFVSYAKYSRLGEDLFSAVLEEHMGGDFYVKCWGKLHKPLQSNCSVTNKVYNVNEVQLPTTEPFSPSVDHSKWSVTVDGTSTPWTCIADMNREVSQMGRGGGAVCTDNPAVWRAFSSIVVKHEPCPITVTGLQPV